MRGLAGVWTHLIDLVSSQNFLIHANNRSILGDDSGSMHLLLLKSEMADWALKVLGGTAKQSVDSALK